MLSFWLYCKCTVLSSFFFQKKRFSGKFFLVRFQGIKTKSVVRRTHYKAIQSKFVITDIGTIYCQTVCKFVAKTSLYTPCTVHPFDPSLILVTEKSFTSQSWVFWIHLFPSVDSSCSHFWVIYAVLAGC